MKGGIEKIDFLSSLGIMDSPTYSDEEVEQKEKERLESEKMRHYRESGVGDKFLSCCLGDFVCYNSELEKNLRDVTEYIKDINFGVNRDLWLIGENGNGKTFLGCMIVRECWGRYVESSVIEDEIEQTRHYSATESMSQLRDRYLHYKLLVIDEVARFPSDAEKKYLFKIINDRYNAEKPTVLISNLTVPELKEYLGRGLVDRAIEKCTTVVFSSPSYRQKKRAC